MPTLTSYFNDMDDPRGGNAPRHKFCDLMTISLCVRCAAVRRRSIWNFLANEGKFLARVSRIASRHSLP